MAFVLSARHLGNLYSALVLIFKKTNKKSGSLALLHCESLVLINVILETFSCFDIFFSKSVACFLFS